MLRKAKYVAKPKRRRNPQVAEIKRISKFKNNPIKKNGQKLKEALYQRGHRDGK